MTSGEKRFLLFIWLLALALRVGYAFSVNLIPANYLGIDMDAVEYDYLGWSIAQGHGVVTHFGDPTSLRFPGYPYFLGLIYFLFGHHHMAALLAQALLGSLAPILIFLTARQFFPLRISQIAGLLGAIHPGFIYFVGWLMGENLLIFLISLLLYITVSLNQDKSWKRLTLLGVVLGLVSLTRGNGLPFLGMIPIYVYFRFGGSFRTRVGRAGLVAGVAVLMMIPWTIRNYLTYDRLMLPASEGGIVLWLGFHNIPLTHYETQEAYAYVDTVSREGAKSEEFYRLLAMNNYSGVAGLQWLFKQYYPEEPPPQSEPEAGERLGRKAMTLLLQNPMVWVVKSIKQVFRFWHVLDERGRFVNGYAFILPFFLAGAWITRRRWHELFPLYFFLFVLYALSILFFADARLRLPFEGILIVIGACGIEQFLGIFRRIYLKLLRNQTVQSLQGAQVRSNRLISINVRLLRLRLAMTKLVIATVSYWGYGLLFAFFAFGFYLRMHSPQVRLALRSIAEALGFKVIDMQ